MAQPKGPHLVIDRHSFSHLAIEEFARLLPSLDVVAISQAPSPGPCPNTPSGVNVLQVPYTCNEN